jgi:S-adenosylmethionine:tRNA ribosyltransferase-isomerase
MKTSDFDYLLPPGLIAQTPIEPRDSSRLMVLDRTTKSVDHRRFTDICGYLRPGDVMVFNNSRVIPARLKAKRTAGGGKVEILLLRRMEAGTWEALTRPARKLQTGAVVEIIGDSPSAAGGECAVIAEVIGTGENGLRTIRVSDETRLMAAGEMPLPPYIHTPLADRERYQTVYARDMGSAAAPTAGLHFTPELLKRIEGMGVRFLFTTLHIGLDTFRPVTEEDPQEHIIHREYGILDSETAKELTLARREGRRVICTGTTSARIVEHAAGASKTQEIEPFRGWVDLFILPGYRFRAVDTLITNFHLPKSTLLMLVSAFAGKELIDKAYREAIEQRYRFYSFGDAMLIL